MSSVNRMAEIAAAVGDPSRASILSALMDGRSLTAKELAFAAGVSAPTASGHLAALSGAGLLVCTPQGRHRYFRLASPLVGSMLENIMTVASATQPSERLPAWRGPEALRMARTCYDHLAGRLGVAIAARLEASGHVVLGADGGEVTEAGRGFLAGFGISPEEGGSRRRIYRRPCLDWSERRSHLAGRVGAAIAERCFALGWIERMRDSRAV